MMQITIITNSSKSGSGSNSIIADPVHSSTNLFQGFKNQKKNGKLKESEVIPKEMDRSNMELDPKPRRREIINKVQKQKTQSKEEENKQSSSRTSMSDSMDNENSSKLKMRIVGGVVFLLMIMMTCFHAFSSNINTGYYNTNSSNAFVGAGLLLSTIFVILGFGLTLAYYGESALSSFFTVLYTVSLTMILEPFLLKFWLNLFNKGFGSEFDTGNQYLTILYTSNTGSSVSINYWNMRLSLTCAISQLLIYFAATGRIQIYKIMIANFCFILIWTLNYGIVIFFIYSSAQSRINDDFGICFQYLFGGFAGLVVILDSPSRIITTIRRRSTAIYPKILAIIGTFFMCISFALTHSIIGKKDGTSSTFTQITDQRVVFYPEGAIGTFFAISSSVLSTAAWSIIFNHHHTFALTDFIGSSISGAIMFGPVAEFTSNLGIPVILGLGAGFLSVLYKTKLMPKINKKKIMDSMGLLGPFLIVPFVGNFLTTPVIIFCYSTYNIQTPQLGYVAPLSTSSRYLYIYYILCSVMGLLGGISVSSIFRWFRGNQKFFGDRLTYKQILSLKEIQLDYSEYSTKLQDVSQEDSQSKDRKKQRIKKQIPRKHTGRQTL